ncbi:MAG: methyltransferase domain-containing protein [Thiotrichales bacterium]
MSIAAVLGKWLVSYDSDRYAESPFRTRRLRPLLDLIAAISTERGEVSIVDVGGTERYWDILPDGFLDQYNATVTVVNLPDAALPREHGRFRFVCCDGCDLSAFADQSFDIAHSNSVVEHVGDWPRMIKFASEVARVGKCYFVQTPNYWFPVEPHFMTLFYHWLPTPIRVWLILHFRLGHYARATTVDKAMEAVESARLLDRRMFQSLFSDGVLLRERFLGLTKSFVAMRR